MRFTYDGDWDNLLDQIGEMPTPPYIHEKLEDKSQYQTVYAKYKGSAAAPTAGLHFTPELLEEMKARGAELLFVTLHVGIGTFRPVAEENIEDHEMHREWYTVSEETAEKINQARAEGRRIIAVGTTSVRTLESAGQSGQVEAGSRWTQLYIYPGYQWHIVDAIVTNFHLPESTLIMMMASFAGRENILRAYEEAVRENTGSSVSATRCSFIKEKIWSFSMNWWRKIRIPARERASCIRRTAHLKRPCSCLWARRRR